MSGRGAPLAAARLGCLLVVRTIPALDDRLRYRAEFSADLAALSAAEQLRYTAGVVSQLFALRSALRTSPAALAETAPPTVSFGRWVRCHILRWHDWRTFRTDDGVRYSACSFCGRFPVDTVSRNGFGIS